MASNQKPKKSPEYEDPCSDIRKRYSALETQRSTWMQVWQEINTFILPYKGSFTGTDPNNGAKKGQAIINGTGTWALRTLASGMHSGISNPARVWFELTVSDPDLAEDPEVRGWLETAQQRTMDTFARSNIYQALHSIYELLGGYGTAVLYTEEDPQTILRAYVWPMGQYVLANGSRNEVDTAMRTYRMTVGQLVQKFGLEKCSPAVQDQYKRGNIHDYREVVHAIEPNDDYASGELGAKGKPWVSRWFESGGKNGGGSYTRCFLREDGYDEFPCCCPRWGVNDGDVYGTSPGMDALGDIRGLQQLERKKARVLDKHVDPPMVASPTLQGQRASLLPGEITYVYESGQGRGFAPAIEVSPAAMPAAEESIQKHEYRINRYFMADVMMMISNSEDPQKTAEEIRARQQEKMLQLGPTMERLNAELFTPLIERTVAILMRNGLIPKPPPQLQGRDIMPKYVSIMAQAQKALGNGPLQAFAGFVGNLASVTQRPDVLDKIDIDELIEEYADNLGVSEKVVVPEEKVQAIRQQRAQMAAQQQAMAQAMAAAQGAKTLSQADTGGDNALTRALPPVAGGAPAGGMVQ